MGYLYTTSLGKIALSLGVKDCPLGTISSHINIVIEIIRFFWTAERIVRKLALKIYIKMEKLKFS